MCNVFLTAYYPSDKINLYYDHFLILKYSPVQTRFIFITTVHLNSSSSIFLMKHLSKKQIIIILLLLISRHSSDVKNYTNLKIFNCYHHYMCFMCPFFRMSQNTDFLHQRNPNPCSPQLSAEFFANLLQMIIKDIRPLVIGH